jgi:SAM-dependent methyltransferase
MTSSPKPPMKNWCGPSTESGFPTIRHFQGRCRKMEATNLCPIWTPLYIHRRRLFQYISAKLPSIFSSCHESTSTRELKVLDVGCGSMPYRSLFAGRTGVGSYEGADIDNVNAPAVRIDPASERIFAEDNSYDLIVSFQVLEHVPRPNQLIAECQRILRPGGVLFFTAPFVFEYHAVPGDYHRWTMEGLAYDLGLIGFTGVGAETVESDWESVITVMQCLVARKFGYVLGKPLFLALNLLSWLPVRVAPGLCPLTIGAWGTKPAVAVQI